MLKISRPDAVIHPRTVIYERQALEKDANPDSRGNDTNEHTRQTEREDSIQ